jgi:hypothetical protein
VEKKHLFAGGMGTRDKQLRPENSNGQFDSKFFIDALRRMIKIPAWFWCKETISLNKTK